MGKIQARQDGQVIDVQVFFKENFPHLIKIIDIAKKFIVTNLDNQEIEVELNFIQYPDLREEILLDPRFNTPVIIKEHNMFRGELGAAFYSAGPDDPNKMLQEEFRHLRIAYVSITDETDFLVNALVCLRELHHFCNEYDSSMDFLLLDEGIPKYIKYIEFLVRDILYDFTVEYKSYEHIQAIIDLHGKETYDFEPIFKYIIGNLSESTKRFLLMTQNISSIKQNIDIHLLFCKEICKFFARNVHLTTFIHPQENFRDVWNYILNSVLTLNRRLGGSSEKNRRLSYSEQLM